MNTKSVKNESIQEMMEALGKCTYEQAELCLLAKDHPLVDAQDLAMLILRVNELFPDVCDPRFSTLEVCDAMAQDPFAEHLHQLLKGDDEKLQKLMVAAAQEERLKMERDITPESEFAADLLDELLKAPGGDGTSGVVNIHKAAERHKVIAVTLIRVRGLIGFDLEQFVDTLYLPAPAEDLQGRALSDWAIQTLRENIASALQSKWGWESICRACLDYNWGDAVMEPECDIKFFNCQENNFEIVGEALCSVNQDELLAPSEVTAHYRIEHGHGGPISTGDCEIDFTTGRVSFFGDYVFKDGDRGTVRLLNGDILELEPQVGLTRLKEIE